MQIKTSHIYWFAHYNMLGPCTRYRGRYVLEKINELFGIPYDFIYPSYKLFNVVNFLKIYLEVLLFRKKDSIIVFQKTYTIGIYSFLLKLLIFFRNKKTVYDIDDAYYIKFPPSTIHYFLKKCKICITGSESLSNYAKTISKNESKVTTLSSPILNHNNIKESTNPVFTIGWTGFYNYHRDSLIQLLFPALKKIKEEINLTLLGVVKEAHFIEIKTYFKEYKNINLHLPNNIDWLDEDLFYKEIMKFDVGVSPLLDTEENRAKSAFKLKQYLCCGVPVIGSDTGENSKIIKDEVNGFIANDSSIFLLKLENIMKMKNEERMKLSKEALKSVKQYEMVEYCNKFMKVIEKFN